MAATHNLQADQGSTFVKTFQWLLGENPVDLVALGYASAMQVRANYGEPVLLDAASPGNMALEANGNITVTFTAAQMAAVEAGKYLYDLDVYLPNGYRKTLVRGSFTVIAEVTQP